MATRTIHTLKYQLLVDSSDFEKGMIASRSELNMARREMRSMLSPAEKMEVALEKLGKLAEKDAKFQDLYNRKLTDYKKLTYDASEAAQRQKAAEEDKARTLARGKSMVLQYRSAEEKHVDTLQDLHRLKRMGAIDQETYTRAIKKSRDTLPSVIRAKDRLARAEKDELVRVQALTAKRTKYKLALIAGAAVAAGVAARAGKAVANNVKDQINELDDLAKKAEKLGVGTEYLTRWQFASQRVTGLSYEASAKGLEKFIRRTSEAAQGTGELVNVYKELNLDARALAAMDPGEAVQKVARAMDSYTSAHDRVRIATKLFDDEQAGLHTMLKLSNAELKKQFDLADQLGRTVSQYDAEQAVRAKDAIGEMADTFNSFSREFATTIAPSMVSVLREITSTMQMIRTGGRNEKLGSFKDFDTSIGDVVAGNLRTGSQVLTDPRKAVMGWLPNYLGNINDVTAERYNERANFENKQRTKAIQAELAERKLQQKEFTRGMFSSGMDGAGSIRDGLKQALSKAMGGVGSVNDFLGSTHVRLNGRQRSDDPILSEITSGPMDSIAAGSSEAFKLLNQTTAVNSSTELDLAKTTAKGTVQTVTVLEQIKTLHEMNKWERKAYEDEN